MDLNTSRRWLLTSGAVLAVVVVAGARQQKSLPEGYMRPGPALGVGLAPAMEVRELSRAASRTYRITFGTGDKLLPGLTEFASRNHIVSARVMGIGGFSSATLGWDDPAVGAMKEIAVNRKCELVSLTGDISTRHGSPYVHLHAVVSFSDGSTKGGHLLDARVAPLAEIFVMTAGSPAALPASSR